MTTEERINNEKIDIEKLEIDKSLLKCGNASNGFYGILNTRKR